MYVKKETSLNCLSHSKVPYCVLYYASATSINAGVTQRVTL